MRLAGLRAASRDRKSREAAKHLRFGLCLTCRCRFLSIRATGHPSGHADDAQCLAGRPKHERAVRELKSIQCAPEQPATACMHALAARERSDRASHGLDTSISPYKIAHRQPATAARARCSAFDVADCHGTHGHKAFQFIPAVRVACPCPGSHRPVAPGAAAVRHGRRSPLASSFKIGRRDHSLIVSYGQGLKFRRKFAEKFRFR